MIKMKRASAYHQFVALAIILVLATTLLGLPLTGALSRETIQSQVHNCGVVGVISFVALCLVAGPRQVVAPESAPPSAEQTAARRSLYEALSDIGLPMKN
jgi:hypothetical protein